MTDVLELGPEFKPPPPFVPGDFPDMPAEQYHAIEAMSASGAKQMIITAAHYRMMRETPLKPSPPMNLGTATHTFVLEPEREDTIKIGPGVGGKGKAWDEFAAAHPGATLVTAEQYDMARIMARNVAAHPAAKLLLDGARVEGSLFWQDGKYGVPCKMRFDALNVDRMMFGDLKTARSAAPEEFARAAATLDYHIQEANYRSGCEHVLDFTPRGFVFIVVENEPPHLVACYTLPAAAVMMAGGLLDLALERYKQALDSGRWAGYPQSVDVLPFPKWAMRVNL